MRLEEKIAVVTGAGRGIGKAVALAFAKEGADLVVVDLDTDLAEGTAKEIETMGRRAMAIKTDVSIRDQVEELVKKTVEHFGRIDIWVNNAGIVRPAMLHKMTYEQWKDVIDVHLNGTFYCLQTVAKVMMEQKSGKIINVISAAGISGTIGQINYSSAKAGIIGMTKSAAKELGKHGINVNAIGPAAITRMTEKIYTDPKLAPQYLARKPIPRFVQPEEVTGAFVFFASDEANYITGQVLNVDGGTQM
jgi:3-oxoacyl-[acyl-carrier protein] reductase